MRQKFLKWSVETFSQNTSEGWAAFTPNGHYKLGGNLAGAFW